MRRFNLKVVSVAFAGFWAYKRARRAQQQIPQGAKNPQGKLKQAIYKLADSKVIRFLKWLVDERRLVYGVVLPLVFDIDRAHDVEAAEQAGLGRWREIVGA